MRGKSWFAAILLTWMSASSLDAQGVERRVPAGGDLQQALNEARAGDRIILEPGATYTGNFVLPVHSGSDFVTVTTDPASGDLPAAGKRVTPDDAAMLAKIQARDVGAALRTAPGAHHWRLLLLEFPGARSSDIVLLGDGSSAQRSLDDVPHNLVIDRCYIHGDEITQKRGVALNSGRTTIVGSYIAGIARAGQDTQAIGGWNGPGPYLIENNYLEGGAENFMLGGALPTITGLVPSDVTFRGNHVTRRLSWRERKIPVKNLFELKNARRVLVEFNLFENNWARGQSGYAIVLTPRGESGRAPWSTVEDVTFRYNIVRHSGSGINVSGHDDGGSSGQLRRLRISQNLFYDIDGGSWGGNGVFLQMGGGPADIVVEHNTIQHTGSVIVAYGGTRDAPVPIRGLTFRNNLSRHNRYGVFGDGRGVGNAGMRVFFPDVLFTDNVLAGGNAAAYPPDNLFPSVDEFERQFVDFEGHDFRLKPESIFRGKASDGGDLGADVTRILSGVRDENERREPERARPPKRRPGDVSMAAALVAASLTLARVLAKP